MRLRLPERASTWTARAILLVEIALIMFWLGLALQIQYLVMSAAIMFSYLTLVLGLGSGLPTSIRLERRLSKERVTESQMLVADTTVNNESASNCVLTVLEEYPPGLDVLEGSTNYLAFLPSHSEIHLSSVLRADFRGHYLLPPSTSKLTDELNLREREVPDTGKALYLTVLPPIEDLSDFQVSSRASQPEIGTFKSGSVGIGTEFYGIRDYSPGDDLRRINWKASARTEQLLSNEYEREHVTNIYLFVDLTSQLREDLRWVVRASASIATYLLRTRNRLGLVVLGEGISHVQIESGRRQLFRVIDKLVTAEPGGSGEPTQYLRRLIDQIPKCEIFVITPLKSETVADTVAEIRARRERVCVLVGVRPKSEELERDLILKAATRLIDLRRAAVLHRFKNAEIRVIEVPFETPIQSAVSLIEEGPIRR
jgi:uncharacterized protein (DUF58 family)